MFTLLEVCLVMTPEEFTELYNKAKAKEEKTRIARMALDDVYQRADAEFATLIGLGMDKKKFWYRSWHEVWKCLKGIKK